MTFVQLPSDLLEATTDLSDPLRRYAALMVCWGMNPLDVTCRDLLTPGGKNSLPTPTEAEWETVIEHKVRWEALIKAAA